MPKSFHEEDLEKITKAISGIFKRSARTHVAASLRADKVEVDMAKRLGDASSRKIAFSKLLNEAKSRRHNALRMGASGYGHPQWAAASAAESWLATLWSEEEKQNEPGQLQRVERMIVALMSF